MKHEDLSGLISWRGAMKSQNRSVVLTNGCFDLIHAGHLHSLEKAADAGDELVVAINGNESVRELKGSARPICDELDRAALLAGFSCVSKVVIFPETRLDGLIRKLKPDVYVKGGDYTIETLDPGEREALLQNDVTIRFISFVDGRSTSGIIERIKADVSILDSPPE